MKLTYEQMYERDARREEFNNYCELMSLNQDEVAIAKHAWNAALNLAAEEFSAHEGTSFGVEIILKAL